MKTRISLAPAFLALSLLATPAFAAETPADAEDDARVAAGLADALAQPFGQDPVPVTGCTAEQNNCPNGNQISCTGTQSCDVYFCSVVCDGQATYCCDISGLDCPERACAYCHCLSEGIYSPQECEERACSLFPWGSLEPAAGCEPDRYTSVRSGDADDSGDLGR